ncbi:MAG: putative transcriptional regulator [Verrucomicrobiales bacterium]|jgi:predicted transcriptional regulator
MATTRRTRFSRRIPDHVTDELVNVLSDPKTYEFNSLFELVYENLKERNAVSGGEEMLRLRAYEKLQNLVTRGLVEKAGKKYRGLERIEEASSKFIAAAQAAAQAQQQESS